MKKILIIDFCNYTDYQIGGHLSFAKNLIIAFGDDLALIGITTDIKDPVGQWFKKTIDGVTFDYFALKRYTTFKTKHILPDRLVCFLLLRYFKKRILEINIQNVFIQRHEILPAINKFNYGNICYRFPGLESPLSISKYWIGKYVSNQFNKLFFSSFTNVNLIIAAGDENSIEEMAERSNGNIKKNMVVKFPTRISTDIFKPSDKSESRSKMNLSKKNTIISTTGRLASFKGWKFMIDSFILFQNLVPDSQLYFIGEGEDYKKIQDYISLKALAGKVILAGKKNSKEIASFLSASDLFIMGSYKEGWSTSLIEAIACGIPACVTNFSSAKDIIIEGKNGYVINEHNAELFAQGMLNALQIPTPIDNNNILAYSVDKLKNDLLKIWELI